MNTQCCDSFVVEPRKCISRSSPLCSITHFLCLVRAAWCASSPSDSVSSLEWWTAPGALSAPNHRTLQRSSSPRACNLPGHDGYPFTGPHTRSPTSNFRLGFSLPASFGLSSASFVASTERLSHLA